MFFELAEKAAPSDDQETTTPEATPEQTRLGSEIHELEQSICGGGFPVRCAIGSRFARDPEGGLHPGYTGNRSQKRAFRDKWARTKIHELKQIRERSETFRNIDAKKGIYRPFFRECGKSKEGAKTLRLGTQQC